MRDFSTVKSIFQVHTSLYESMQGNQSLKLEGLCHRSTDSTLKQRRDKF